MRRWWILGSAAVLFALAAGIALGAGLSLSEPETNNEEGIAATSVIDQFDADVAVLMARPMIAGTLSDQNVAIVGTPNVAPSTMDDVTQSITDAGGKVAAQITLMPPFLDSTQRQFVESVAQQSHSNLATEPGMSSYSIAARALGDAIINDSDQGTTVLRAFVEGDLITVEKNPEGKATVVLVVGGSTRPAAGEGTIVAELAAELGTMSSGAVIAGPSLHSLTRGFIAEATPGTVSTFDALDSPPGRSLTALILAAEARGTSGSWGTSRAANGTVPNL